MPSLISSVLLLGAATFAAAQSQCSFGLAASGGQTGTLGQLTDGQIRIGGSLAPSIFTIVNGTILDPNGFGCLLTPVVEQFQCDYDRPPMSGFSIANNGSLEYNGNAVFYACPSTTYDWNIYTVPVPGQAFCSQVTLTANNCYGAGTTVANSCATVTSGACISVSASTTTSTFLSTSSSLVSSTSTTIISSTLTSTSVIMSTSSSIISSTTTSTVLSSTTATLPPTTSLTTSSSSFSSTAPITTSSTSSSTVSSSSSSSTRLSTTTTSPPSTSTVSSTSSSTRSSTSIPVTTTTTTTTLQTVTTSTSRTTSSTTTSALSCATSLTGNIVLGNFQYPHLLVPITSSNPYIPTGSSLFGTVSSTTSTIFNFDIPLTYAGDICSLIFLLPPTADLAIGASYTFTGSGQVLFRQLSSFATVLTTYSNAPSVSANLGTFTLVVGQPTLVSTFSCQAGQTVAYEMTGVGNTYLNFLQDYNPSALGLYITQC